MQTEQPFSEPLNVSSDDFAAVYCVALLDLQPNYLNPGITGTRAIVGFSKARPQ